MQLPTDNNPQLNLVIVHKNDGTSSVTTIKPSRIVSRIYLIGVLSEVLGMLITTPGNYVDPKDCPLNIVLTIDEDSIFGDAEVSLDEDEDMGDSAPSIN